MCMSTRSTSSLALAPLPKPQATFRSEREQHLLECACAQALAKGFNECLATPENLEKWAAELRFAVGEEVECQVGGWRRGKVRGQMQET